MAKLGGVLKIIGVAAVAVACGVGGTFGVMHYLPLVKASHSAGHAPPPPPQPLYFADLPNMVVSIAPEPGAPPTSYVQFELQFVTHNQLALASFDALQPIIRANIISLLMTETSNSLQDPQVRADLLKNCLAISNGVLTKNGGFNAPNPFAAAYITNLVVQD